MLRHKEGLISQARFGKAVKILGDAEVLREVQGFLSEMGGYYSGR